MENWKDQAECISHPTEWFYPDHTIDGISMGDDGTIGAPISLYAQAKEICSVCPVRIDCLDEAMENKERYGCWGSLAPIERLRIERKHRRKRLLDRRKREGQ